MVKENKSILFYSILFYSRIFAYTLLLAVYFMSNPLANHGYLYRRGQPQGQHSPSPFPCRRFWSKWEIGCLGPSWPLGSCNSLSVVESLQCLGILADYCIVNLTGEVLPYKLLKTPQLKPMNSTSVRKGIVYRFTCACIFIMSSLLCDLNFFIEKPLNIKIYPFLFLYKFRQTGPVSKKCWESTLKLR